MMLPFTIINKTLLIGRHTTISFNRTLRVPEDGKHYDLPAGFGRLPIVPVSEVADRVPKKWREEGGLIIPLYQREALYLEFEGVKWRPTIAKVAVGRINAITGEPHDLLLKSGRQDYVVIPTQKWLDGINTKKGIVKQFVAMPLGEGYTIEAQVTDEEEYGGFQLAAYDPHEGEFTEPRPPTYIVKAPQTLPTQEEALYAQTGTLSCQDSLPHLKEPWTNIPQIQEMGIAAGGSIKQQIFEDNYGISTWNSLSVSDITIHIVNSEIFSEITGQAVPPTPITKESYIRRGFPWYSHYDETRKTVSASRIFKNLLSVFQIDKSRGMTSDQNTSASGDFSKSPKVQVKTPSLVERINSLNAELRDLMQGENYSEILNTARTLGELLENHSENLHIEGMSVSKAASDAYMFAGFACLNLRKFRLAEDFSNRALNSYESVSALELRMFARAETGKLESAKSDCEAVLRKDPNNKGAMHFLTVLDSNKS